jgi:hypothetical protein
MSSGDNDRYDFGYAIMCKLKMLQQWDDPRSKFIDAGRTQKFSSQLRIWERINSKAFSWLYDVGGGSEPSYGARVEWWKIE